MCNCQNEMTELVKKRLGEQQDIVKVLWCLPNYTFSNSPKAVIEAAVCAEKQLKNGKTKQVEGNSNLVATYCPFCGVKYDAE